MAHEASIHVGTLMQATMTSIDLRILSTAFPALRLFMYDGINITYCGYSRLALEGLHSELDPFAYPDPMVLAYEQRSNLTENGIITTADRSVVFCVSRHQHADH